MWSTVTLRVRIYVASQRRQSSVVPPRARSLLQTRIDFSLHRCVVFLFLDVQDFLQIISMFASFKLAWPPTLLSLYKAMSFANFNLELLAPECSFKVTFEARWFVTQSLPLVLAASVIIVLLATRLLQWTQRRVFRVMPWGAVSDLDIVDVCIGILITGSYYLYFRKNAQALNAFVLLCATHSLG